MNVSLNDIVMQFGNSASFLAVQAELDNGSRHIELTGLCGSAKPLLIACLFRQSQRTIFVLTGTSEEAEAIRDDLEEFGGPDSVRLFPPRAIPSFRGEPQAAESMALRLETLADLGTGSPRVAVAPIQAVLDRVLAPANLRSRIIELRAGQSVDLSQLARRLVELGFEREPQVEKIGRFSIRGGIVDVYPFASEKPVRIELAGDQIESVRTFDIRSQRTTGRRPSVTMLPCSDEPNLNEEEDSGLTPATIADYLPPTSILFVDEPELIERRAQASAADIPTSSQSQEVSVRYPAGSYEQIQGQLGRLTTVTYRLIPTGPQTAIDMGSRPQEPFHGDLKLLRAGLNRLREDGFRTYLVCDTQSQAERLKDLGENLAEGVLFQVSHLHGGFLLPEAKLAVYTDHEIFHRHRLPHHTPKYTQGAPIKSIGTLHRGDIVVHLDYGIGRFEGLRHITAQGKQQDCLSILYENNDRLYVPIDQLNQVQKYVGADGAVPRLNKLGGIQWERTKERTKKAIAAMADDLIRTAAARKSQRGHAFSPPSEWHRELEAAFPYEETLDQLKAIEEVMHDMEQPVPMDRLICGDVGYGKTEVAIRAAFKAVMDNKQTAILVPTTILAQQHGKTFQERMKTYPVKVEMLSRFKSRAEQRQILADLKTGKVDIIIGTHRLLQKDVQFRDLGLLVIDEEQRFGVSHKERLKKLKTVVDVLTLTATPIPRTLHMSLLGARDMSVINTAPRDRVPIETSIIPFDEDLIRSAILREVGRGGQVYFVHNRVQSIQAMSRLLEKIVPGISIAIGHGQMDEHDLEQQMLNFLSGRYDCLLSTMIIEAGLDIPNVNTIIINRADRFGLAQLYQLRGRVGRSDRLAHAYLLVPPPRSLSETARQRLQALREFTQLGSGFQLAMRDLEIRGAGNLLGPQQHGFIAAVGFDLYCRLLAQTVQELKGEPVPTAVEPKLEMAVDAYIPESYVPDSEQKMEIYQRLAGLSSYEAALDMEEEMRDRFGAIPTQVRTLLGVIAVRTLARESGVSRVSLEGDTLSLQFVSPGSSSRQQIEMLLSHAPVPVAFEAEGALVARMTLPRGDDEATLDLVRNLLLHLRKAHKL